MAYVIAVCNQKGGVGKTSTSVNLAAALSQQGKRVLLVDMDPQANASSTLNGAGSPTNIYHTLAGGILPEDIVKTTQHADLDLLPSSADLAGATIELVQANNREFRLHDVVARLRDRYDFVIIDCPPSLGLLTLNSLVAADHVMIPVQCEYYAMEGLGQLLNTVEMVKRNLGKRINVLGAVCTMYDRRNRLSRAVLKEVRRNFPGYVFDAVIPRNIAIAEAPGYGKTIHEFDAASPGALAYRNLAHEVAQQVTTFQ